MDLRTFALVIIAMAAFAFLVLIALVGYVVIRYRPTVVGILGLLGGAAWVASPVDPIPEAVFGPLGLTDDVAVMLAMALYVARLAARRRTLRGPAPSAGPADPLVDQGPRFRFGTPQPYGTAGVQDDD